MKAVVLYHPSSDHAGIVADYAAEFERFKKHPLELVSLETIQGADLAQLYAVDQYPAILAMSDNGSLLRLWQGLPMPLMDELSYYLQDAPAVAGHQGRTIAIPSLA